MAEEEKAPSAPPAPRSDTKLTQEQIQQATNWLNAHWLTKGCPFHPGPTNWQMGDTLVGTVGFAPGGIAIGGPTFPLLVLTCTQCGHTVFVNSIVAGITPRAIGATGTGAPKADR